MARQRIDNLKASGPKKGASRNPKGSNEKQRARKLAKDAALADPTLVSPAEIARQFLVTMGGGPEIARLAEDMTGNCYKTALARAWTVAISTGDLKGIELFVDRVIGKPKAMVSLCGSDGGPLELNVSRTLLTTEEKIARIKQLAKAREEGLHD